MVAMRITRRSFCSNTALALLSPKLLHPQPQSQSRALPGTASAHADVAAIDHDRILTAAQRYLTEAPAPLTAFPAPNSPGTPHDFYSEVNEEKPPAPTGPNAPAPPAPHGPAPFTAHSDALLNFSIQVSTLVAAFVLTKEDRYAEHAAAHLRAWFVTPATSMTPALPFAQLVPGTTTARFEGILETVQLAEVAQAISFLPRSEALSPEELAAIYAWFATYLEWLGTNRTALLARDQKNHHGTSWLLQAAAFARLAPEDSGGARKVPAPATPQTLAPPPNQYISLNALRHQYKSVTLRAQITAEGNFQHELTTPWPYRFSLFNLDMLAGICDLLSTRFESIWDYELQDDPSMRVAIAHHFPFIAHRGAWPYRADITHFTELPLRQPSLLLSGRAYSRPEYTDLWKTLPPDPTDPALQRTFPMRQPLLWIRRAPAM
jgi:Alginate lyase